jgi:hypothetical protein
MSTQTESRFIIIKRDGATAKFLRHEGHNHFWTLQRTEAMEYTKLEVAEALAKKNGGTVSLA